MGRLPAGKESGARMGEGHKSNRRGVAGWASWLLSSGPNFEETAGDGSKVAIFPPAALCFSQVCPEEGIHGGSCFFLQLIAFLACCGAIEGMRLCLLLKWQP